MVEKIEMPPWAESIVGQAIAEIAGGASDEDVIEKVSGTALAVQPKLWKEFLRIVKVRREIANKFGRH